MIESLKRTRGLVLCPLNVRCVAVQGRIGAAGGGAKAVHEQAQLLILTGKRPDQHALTH